MGLVRSMFEDKSLPLESYHQQSMEGVFFLLVDDFSRLI